MASRTATAFSTGRGTEGRRLLCGTFALIPCLTCAAGTDSTSKAGDDSLTEVVVTGTLIRDPNRDSPSPIATVSAEDIQQSGALSIEQALNQRPEFAAAGTSANGGQGTGGHATINMHALGANRNLVLLDGRRLPLADSFGIVDVNFIPDAILSGVQTITGGASAVYGSDAISGVVNFQTLRSFEGAAADLQYGNSVKGDYGQTSASLAFGTKFADERGHALLSVSYAHRDALYGRERSAFAFVTPSSFIGQGTFVPSANNLPSQAAVSTLFSGYGVTGTVRNTLNLGFNDDGSLFAQTGARNYKGPTTGAYAIIAGNVRMPVGPQTIIENPLDRKSVFSKFDYRLAPGITAYGQVLYIDSTVYTSSGGSLTQIGTLTTIPVTNPFIPQDLRTLLASRANPNAPFLWNGRYVGIPYKAWDEAYRVAQYLGGLKGELGFKDWSWDVYASFDTTDHLQSNYNAVLKSQVQNLLNAPDGGNSLCAGGFDPFGLIHSTQISAACQAYMTTTAHSTESLSQHVFQGTVQGSLFELPAGPVILALLGDHRRNSYTYSPDANLAATNIEAVAGALPTRGVIAVTEAAAQLDVPLLKDLPGVTALNLGAAFRRSDYSTSGVVNSFEGDLRWRPVEAFLVRGSFQRAVRAPNIGELFSAPTLTQVAFGTPPAAIGDPCDIRSPARTGANGAAVRQLCLEQGVPASVIDSYQFPTTATGGLSQGNRLLKPETANTYNVGVSWSPHFESAALKDLSLSLDYYSIRITDVISVVPGLTALSKCFNLDGSNPAYSPGNTFCGLMNRDANGQLQIIDLPYLNLGGLETSGVDFGLNWAASLRDLRLAQLPGRILFGTNLGYLGHYSVQTLPGASFQDYAGTNTISQNYYTSASFPQWKALTTLGYNVGGVTASLRWHYQSAMKDVTAVTQPTAPGVGVSAYSLFDLFFSYAPTERWQLRGGVTNLTNRGIVYVSSSQTSTDTSVFDPVGRAYFVGVHCSL